MVRGHIASGPYFLCGPGLGWGGPELVGSRKAQGEEDQRAQVAAAAGDIKIGQAGLVAIEADIQPAFLCKRLWGVHGLADDGGEGAADLCGRKGGGKGMAPGHIGEVMEGGAAVDDGAAGGGEAAVGIDEPFEDHGIAFVALSRRDFEVFVGVGDAEDLAEKGVDDIAVIIIPMIRRAVGIHAVADIPLLELADAVVDAEVVTGHLVAAEKSFDHAGEQEPVGEAGLDISGEEEGLFDLVLGGGVQVLPEPGGADEGEGHEGGVDEGLAVGVPGHIIFCVGVYGIGDGFEGEGTVFGAEGDLFLGAAFGVEPGCEAAEQAGEGFEIGVLCPGFGVIAVMGEGDGHGGVEVVGSQGGEDGAAEAVEFGEPVVTVIDLGAGDGREGGEQEI